jgi:hypothetical protein
MMPAPQLFATRARACLVFGVFCYAAAPVWAQSDVVLVEEHWELRLGQPDADRSAPQTTMVMSPLADLTCVHFLFILNHVAVPGFEAGGMQVQLWDGEDLLQEDVSTEIGALARDNEVIRWTQRLSLANGNLTFQIVDGESETWGEFGDGDLTVSVPTALTRLNAYRPSVSLTESQVSYAENRVASLVLTKLVWIEDNGEVHVQDAPVPLDTSLDD